MSATDEILAPAPYEADAVFSSDAQSLGTLTVEQDAISPSGERLMTDMNRPRRMRLMEWQDVALVLAAAGFLVLWLFVLPRMGLG